MNKTWLSKILASQKKEKVHTINRRKIKDSITLEKGLNKARIFLAF